MSEWKIYHNPKCSKSRATLEILQSKGIEPEIIEYLKTPPTPKELDHLSSILGKEIKEFVRTKEESYRGLENVNTKELAAAICNDPILLERPIVVRGDRAVIGRPPENVLELF